MPVVAQAAGVYAGRHESWPSVYILTAESAWPGRRNRKRRRPRQAGAGRRLDRQQPHLRSLQLVRHIGQRDAAELLPPPKQPITTSARRRPGPSVSWLPADHRLMQQHVVQHAASNSWYRVRAASSTASLMAMPRLPGESGCAAQNRLPTVCAGWGWRRPPRPNVHHHAAVGFLIVADPHM